jgi:hypothetical protein
LIAPNQNKLLDDASNININTLLFLVKREEFSYFLSFSNDIPAFIIAFAADLKTAIDHFKSLTFFRGLKYSDFINGFVGARTEEKATPSRRWRTKTGRAEKEGEIDCF